MSLTYILIMRLLVFPGNLRRPRSAVGAIGESDPSIPTVPSSIVYCSLQVQVEHSELRSERSPGNVR